MYQLTGIVVHVGETSDSGHYYSITRCWDNENAIKLNDADLPQMLENYQLDNERGIAYMLVFTKKTMNNMQFYRMRLLQQEPM